MDLIEVYTGLKRSQNKRMGQLKVKYGLNHLDILVIGETIAKKDLVFSSTKTEINTKECGLWTKNMDKVLTGEMKIIN